MSLLKILRRQPNWLVLSEAMALIERTQPDAAIVDLTLPGSGGIELVKDLKARHNPLPVLVLSMHVEALYAERALRAGARGYIAKEASPFEVAEAIRKVMAGEIYVSQHVSGAILKRLGHATNEAVRPSGMDLLSDRELEVFQLVGRGLNLREIAGRIHLGSTTSRRRLRQSAQSRARFSYMDSLSVREIDISQLGCDPPGCRCHILLRALARTRSLQP